MKLRSTALLGASLLALSLPAFAGEGLFRRVYTVETVPQGHWEVEQTVLYRTGRAYGSYNAVDLRSEVEYGFTDNFQGAFYLLTGKIDATNAPDDNDPSGDVPQAQGGINRHLWYFQGVSGEFIYRVLNPVKDPIGLAFYYEPTFEIHDQHDGLSYRNFENEYRVMLQKNFLDDKLIVAYNMVAELEMYRYFGNGDIGDPNTAGPNWTAEFDWNNELGVTYRFYFELVWRLGISESQRDQIDYSSHDHWCIGQVLRFTMPKKNTGSRSAFYVRCMECQAA